MNSIFKKASQKFNAEVTLYRTMQKRRTIMKSMVTSQFGYCPLILMFQNRHLNNKTNSIHERALKITYQDNMSTFQKLVNKDKFLIHDTIQKFARFGNRNV